MSRQPPPVLYKYYAPERLDVFDPMDDGEALVRVRFTHPSQFNDLFETTRLGHRISAGHVGIFCLTETADDHLMWVHYAAQHRGFVLGFKTDDPVFIGTDTVFEKVKYRPCPGTIKPPNLRACLYKDRDWKHEKEWRCIKKLKPEDGFWGPVDRNLFVSTTSVTEIIVGSHTSEEFRTSALKRFAASRISISTIDKKARRISHEAYAHELCPRCKGTGKTACDPPS